MVFELFLTVNELLCMIYVFWFLSSSICGELFPSLPSLLGPKTNARACNRFCCFTNSIENSLASQSNWTLDFEFRCFFFQNFCLKSHFNHYLIMNLGMYMKRKWTICWRCISIIHETGTKEESKMLRKIVVHAITETKIGGKRAMRPMENVWNEKLA